MLHSLIQCTTYRFAHVVGLLVIIAAAFLYPTSFALCEEVTARVVSVTDGDTLVVLIGKQRERIRLIGIDTPESKPNRRARKQSMRTGLDAATLLMLGAKATAYTRSLVPRGANVRLEFDIEKRDHYGRLLAYIWLPSGAMLNEAIIRNGYAYPLTIPPNVKYRERFAQGFQESRNTHKGLWGSP